MFGAHKSQTVETLAFRVADDGTFVMAMGLPDMPGVDGGYVILSHYKITSFSFEYKKEGPKAWMIKGWDIDSIEAVHPEFKLLNTKVITRWEYDNNKYTYPERKPKEIAADKPALPEPNAV